MIAENRRGHREGYSFGHEPGGFLIEFAEDIIFLALLLYALRFVFRKGRILAEQRRASDGQPKATPEPPLD